MGLGLRGEVGREISVLFDLDIFGRGHSSMEVQRRPFKNFNCYKFD